MKKLLLTSALVIASVGLTACGNSKPSKSASSSTTSKIVKKDNKPKKKTIVAPDYASAESAERALNQAKDLERKNVRFRINKIEPASAFGYNLEAGKHLNFVSSHNPKVKVGQTVQVKITDVQSTLGSFIIRYKNLTKINTK